MISLAMLYALWQKGRKDLIDLIRPFVLYSVGETTKVGEVIKTQTICEYLEKEFGYRSFQPAVVTNVLRREALSKTGGSSNYVRRENKAYILSRSLSEEIDKFSEKRTSCKAQSDMVTRALCAYLNENKARGRNNYQQEEAERLLLMFFEREGGTVLLDVDTLVQLSYRDNELEYYVAHFILEQDSKKSVLMDYLINLVKGYFVTMALYLQPNNANVTTSSFKEVVFFLDTRILLGCLGLKTKQENDSVKEMIRSLLSSGANLACFKYNVEEVYGILEAYKNARLYNEGSPSPYTLEYLDEKPNGYSLVDSYQRNIQVLLERRGIKCVSPEEVLPPDRRDYTPGCGIDYNEMETMLKSYNPFYNTQTLPDDVNAIETVKRIRGDNKLPYIEKCRAVFVTNNVLLIKATIEYLKKESIDIGFPLAISGDELCVIAWLKNFERNSELPKMRLLENVLAAITPSKELMSAYFEHLDNLERRGEISKEEVGLLRVDLYAKRELMERTHGDKRKLTDAVIDDIREELRREGFAAGESSARQYYESRLAAEEAERKMIADKKYNEQRNNVCKRAEQEADEKYTKIMIRGLIAIKFISILIALTFVYAATQLVDISGGIWTIKNVASVFVAVVTTIQAILPFLSHENILTRCFIRWVTRRKVLDVDNRKRKYLSLIEDTLEKENSGVA